MPSLLPIPILLGIQRSQPRLRFAMNKMETVMLQIDELIEILQDAIDRQTDRDIVDMDLCQIGLAVFPSRNRAVASPDFIDGSWHFDAEMRAGWQEFWGEAYLVRWLPVLSLLDNGELEEIARCPKRTIENHRWVRRQASLIRLQLAKAIPNAAKQLASELQHY
jgi:hypothetical protein